MSRAQSPLNAAQVVARVAGQAIAPATIATGRFVAAETSWSPNQAIVDRPAPNTARIAAVGTGAGPGNRGTLLLSVADEGAGNYFNAVSIGPDGGTTVNNTLVVGTDPGGSELLRVNGGGRFSAKITVAGQSTATLATLADVIAFLQAIHN